MSPSANLARLDSQFVSYRPIRPLRRGAKWFAVHNDRLTTALD